MVELEKPYSVIIHAEALGRIRVCGMSCCEFSAHVINGLLELDPY